MNRVLSALFSLLAVAAPAAASSRDPIEGVWRNRPNTLEVRIAPCGGKLCGTVVGASADAVASTRKAGTAKLVGTQVLTGLQKSPGGAYTGQVFNPNLKIHADGVITLVSPTVLVVKGCVLAGLICRQQHWMRIS